MCCVYVLCVCCVCVLCVCCVYVLCACCVCVPCVCCVCVLCVCCVCVLCACCVCVLCLALQQNGWRRHIHEFVSHEKRAMLHQKESCHVWISHGHNVSNERSHVTYKNVMSHMNQVCLIFQQNGRRLFVQGGEESEDALSLRSFPAIEPYN